MSDTAHFHEFTEASLYISLNELKKRNIQIGEKRTSVTLEPQVWAIMHDIADEVECSVHDLCKFIEERKNPTSSLASAIRVFLISYLHIKMKRAT